MTPSKAFFFISIAFISGIFLQSVTQIPQAWLWGILLAGAALVATTLFTIRKVALAGFCLIFLVLGVARLQVSEYIGAHDALIRFNDSGNKVTLMGRIMHEPEVRDTQQKITVAITDAGSLVLVTAARWPEYHYLDEVRLVGKLKTPPIFEDFDYRDYLAAQGIYSLMDFPSITVVPATQKPTIIENAYRILLWIKGILVQSLNTHFLPPGGPILEGMIFGNDNHLSPELKNKFTVAGLSHVTAVSGTNIVILINILVIALLAAGLWRGQALWGAMVIIWLYSAMIGFPVSGVRAVLMGSVGLLAQYFGRQHSGARVLVLAAGVMLMQQPMLLWHDVSFQLSFLASLGILTLKPLLDGVLNGVRTKMTGWILDIASVTFAAQIATLPVIVYNFGQISLVSPMSNLLVLPVVEPLTVLGILAAVVGAVLPFLGFLASLPCLPLLWYFTKMLDIFSAPWAASTTSHIAWPWWLGYYAIVAAVVAFFHWRARHHHPY